ncbi:UvrD-helicase domain-containing protein [uncultured Pseudodesulfovibrio sp.]|uniref:UvrD-helicase domain-containing protein n=1 Tax=uncultured Pseudodesulfovibrio sp. TaxID=2035858 RepID=UPI0029C76FA8|nr:UvrD-helicase domain-containing protein [uncultured Pseudodesulfovibrio sp.]
MSELRQVKASAGSGKTYQLTRRFLALLDAADERDTPFVCVNRPGRGFTWPEIMAVTFTNKAAAEMKERVVGGLKASALGIEENPACSPETARSTVGAILRRYHRLNIRTIDSLLVLLLRLFALEFGVRPDFEIVFDERELFDAVFDHFLALCETDEDAARLLDSAVGTLIRQEGRNGFWIQDTVRDRLRELTGCVETRTDDLLTDQQAIVGLLTDEYASFRQSVEAMSKHAEETGLPLNKYFRDFLTNCLDMELFDPVPDSASIKKTTVADCVLAKGKGLVDDRSESFYAHLQGKWAEYRQSRAVLAGAYFLAPAIDIGLRLENGLEELQRRQGMVLNSGVAGHVIDLLAEGGAVSEAYCRLGCRLHHLLVDEFQDTNRDQWQAITPLAGECLGKGGSLFFVGDVKQAIYGWRGGDSALFDEVMQQPEIAGLVERPEAENLPDNWRSHRNVVEFNNAFFANLEDPDQAAELADRVLPDADAGFRAEFAGQILQSFRDCAQSLPEKHLNTGGYVRMERLEGSGSGEIEEQTLERLDALMDDLTARRNYRDIGILVRSHTHATLVCDLLVQKNIPVITENSLQLDRHPVVRQLAGFLGFLDFPRDDAAFLAFIGGHELFLAESGLPEAKLLDWLIKPRKKPLGVQFREDFPGPWQRLIEPFYNQSGLMTPYDLTMEAVRVFRVLERHPEAELYVRRFLEVIHLAEENGYGSLSAFLEYWEEKSDQEKVPLPENIDAVRIMTIHKSKGLEFPVTIVPFHHWKTDTDRNFTVREFKGHSLLVPMKKDLGRPYQESLGRAVREQLNLLYVAWTRAREELYGFFPETARVSNPVVLKAMDQFLELDDDGIFEQGDTPSGTQPSMQAARPEPVALPPAEGKADLMGWLPRLRVYRHNLDDYFFNERMRGEVAHRVMEHMMVSGNDTADIERAMMLAVQDFPELGALSDADREKLHLDLRAMAEWALGDDRLREWLAHGVREPEVLTPGGEFKRFDLLVNGKPSVIVDFKTGRPDPHNEVQVREYMDILTGMDDYGAPRGFLVYLDLREIREVKGDA